MAPHPPPGVGADSEPLTVRAWSEEWLRGVATRCQPKTRRLYAHALALIVPLVGALPLPSVTRLHVRGVAVTLAQSYAPSTARLWLSVLAACLAEAVEVGLLRTNPGARPGTLLLRRGVLACYVPEWTEVQRWVRAAEAEHPLYGAIATVLARTGLRIGEALGLQWADVDLDARTLTVRRSGPTATRTKSGRERTVPLSPHALVALRSQLGRDPVWVFVGLGKAQPLRASTVRNALHRARRRAGLPAGLNPHRVRHGVGTELIRQGEPLPSVQALLGHASPGMSLYYARVAGQRRAAQVARLDD